MNIKRNAQGVVDAISAEDIGKFPDTNLAESLQRITGVSIDRSSGEGSTVTVRGFGPQFNLVLLNGRQMPASSLGDCCSAPASRSFDFANLASEGVAAVEVYKSGRATLPTGGIGSVINIRTPRPLDRPGFQGSVAVKGVVDHTFEDTKITPEISGIISKTFADDTVGVLVTGSYQRRKASLAQFNAGWREGYLGSENNWGSLPVDENDWRGNFDQVENRPGPTDVYQVTQNAGYDFTNIDRKRINAQAVLQVKPTDTLSALVDYTFSQNTLEAQTNSIGVWFNHDADVEQLDRRPGRRPEFLFGDVRPRQGPRHHRRARRQPQRQPFPRRQSRLGWAGRAAPRCSTRTIRPRKASRLRPTAATSPSAARSSACSEQTRRFHQRHAGDLGRHVSRARKSTRRTSAPPAMPSATPTCGTGSTRSR